MTDQTVTLRIKGDASGIKQASREAQGEIDKLKGKTTETGQEARKASTEFNGLSLAARSVAAGLATIAAAAVFTRIADEAANIRAQLALATDTTEQFNRASEETFRIAQRTAADLGSTVQLYARLQRATSGLFEDQNAAQQVALQLTETINQSFAVSGASAQEAAGAIRQLAQGLAAGALRGDEFNSVVENSPRLAQALADSLGVTVGELRKLGGEGKLTAEVIVEALREQAQAIAQEYSQLPLTVERAWTNVKSAITRAVGEIDQEVGASSSIAQSFQGLADLIGKLPVVFELWGKEFSRVRDLTLSGTLQLQDAFDVFGNNAGDVLGDMGRDLLILPVNFRLAVATIVGQGEILLNKFGDVTRSIGGFFEDAWLVAKKAAVEAFAGILRSGGQLIDGLIKALADYVQEAAKAFAVLPGFGERAAELGQLAAQLRAAATFEAQYAAGIEATGRAIEDQRAALRERLRLEQEASDARQAAARDAILSFQLERSEALAQINVTKEAADATNNLAANLKRSGDAAQLTAEQMKAAAGAVETLNAVIDRQNAGRDAGVRAALRFRDTMVEIYNAEQDLLALGLLSEDMIKRVALARDAATEALERERRALIANQATKRGEIEQAPKEFAQSWADAFRSVINGFAEFLRSGLRSGEALARGMRNVATKIKDFFKDAFSPENIGRTITDGLDLIAQARFDSQNNPDGWLRTLTSPQLLGNVGRAIQAIDSIFGGRLLGTAFQPSQSGFNVGIGAGGVSGQSFSEEVRQRSFFRGREWRTTFAALDQGVQQALAQVFDTIAQAIESESRALGVDAPNIIAGSFREVRDAQGNITSQASTVGGRTFNEDLQAFGQRLLAENLVAVLTQSDAFRNASNIAERWRADAQTLLQGVEFLTVAARDLNAGINLLGGGAGITEITDFIEGFQRAGETLTQTYGRVTGATTLLEDALELIGADLGLARDAFITFAVDIADAAGGLPQAQALWSSYFDTFYSAQERVEAQLAQAQNAASQAFGRLGLNLGDFSGATGLADFRRQFEAALPTLTPEQVVEWLRAGAALGQISDLSRELAEILGEDLSGAIGGLIRDAEGIAAALADARWDDAVAGLSDYERAIRETERQFGSLRAELVALGANATELAEVEQLRGRALERLAAQEAERLAAAEAARVGEIADIFAGLRFDQQFASLSPVEQALARVNQSFAEQVARLRELGATQAQLAEIEKLREQALGRVILAEQARLAAEAEAERQRIEAERLVALREYATTVEALREEVNAADLTEFGQRIREIRLWAQDSAETLNRQARAAGLASAANEDLALVQQVAALRTAALVRQLEQQGRSVVERLYGTPLSQLEARIRELEGIGQSGASAVGSFGDAMTDTASAAQTAVQRIRQYLDDMLLGPLGGLRPRDALAEAQRQFAALFARAQGGDAEAIAALPQLSDTILRLAQQTFASGDQFFAIRDALRSQLELIANLNPGGSGGGGGGGGGFVGGTPIGATPAELAELYREREALLAQQAAAERRELAIELAGIVRDIVLATGEPLDEIAARLGFSMDQLIADLGISLEELNAGTAAQLAAVARDLGVDLSVVAASVGQDLGSLADAQSLLNDALEAAINDLPEGQRDQLAPLLAGVEEAAALGDNALLEQRMAALISASSGLPAGFRNQLAPFFEELAPVNIDQLTVLSSLDFTAIEQLAALERIEALLDPTTQPVPPPPAGTASVADQGVIAELRALRAERAEADRATALMAERIRSLEAAVVKGAEDQRRAQEALRDVMKAR